ncbi:MAG TPA: hypothetical protein VFV70_11475 [Hyphomonadaceae bacterium]|nr:hypothetical protein [Hyphomonadaceae bacterium]
MGWARIVPLVLAMASVTPVSAVAQNSQASPSTTGCGDARAAKLDGEVPFAGATINYALTRHCANIALYRLTPKLAERRIGGDPRMARMQRDDRPNTGTPHFYARVQQLPGYSTSPSPPPMWADQKTCPALLRAVKGLERAMAPKFTGDGPVRNGSIAVTMDGAGVEVWAGGQLYPSENIGHKYRMNFNTNLGTPTADWVEKTLKDIAPCLSPNEPVMDEPIP